MTDGKSLASAASVEPSGVPTVNDHILAGRGSDVDRIPEADVEEVDIEQSGPRREVRQDYVALRLGRRRRCSLAGFLLIRGALGRGRLRRIGRRRGRNLGGAVVSAAGDDGSQQEDGYQKPETSTPQIGLNSSTPTLDSKSSSRQRIISIARGFAADAVMIGVEAVGIGADNLEAIEWDLRAIQVRWRRRNTDGRVRRIAVSTRSPCLVRLANTLPVVHAEPPRNAARSPMPSDTVVERRGAIPALTIK